MEFFFRFLLKKNLQTYYISLDKQNITSKRHIVGGGGDRDDETETSLNYLSTCVPIHQLQLHKIHEIMLF